MASDLDFFGGDGVLVASPQISLGDGHIQSEPAEDHDKRLKPDIQLAKSEYNRLLFEARMGAVGDAEVRMPWEQGVWKQIFSDDDDDIFPQVVCLLCQVNIYVHRLHRLLVMRKKRHLRWVCIQGICYPRNLHCFFIHMQ